MCLTALPGATTQAQTGIETIIRNDACSIEDLDKASSRIDELVKADQDSRTGGEWTEDTPRRVEVAQIYATGCLQRAEDFHHAALIFQHGNSPEHFYQAWFFATRAVALGDESAEWLIPRAIDRYFMNTGYKQLFGTNTVTQFFYGRSNAARENNFWCLWPTEDGLSDEVRRKYGVRTLGEARSAIIANQSGTEPFEGAECPVDAKSPPEGQFPGIW